MSDRASVRFDKWLSAFWDSNLTIYTFLVFTTGAIVWLYSLVGTIAGLFFHSNCIPYISFIFYKYYTDLSIWYCLLTCLWFPLVVALIYMLFFTMLYQAIAKWVFRSIIETWLP